jgi:hypothetical protein
VLFLKVKNKSCGVTRANDCAANAANPSRVVAGLAGRFAHFYLFLFNG